VKDVENWPVMVNFCFFVIFNVLKCNVLKVYSTV